MIETEDVVEAVSKRLTSEVFELTQPDRGDVFSWFDDHADMLARAALSATPIERLREENARLRDALEPFAKAADIKLCGEWASDKHFGQTDVGFALTFGDLRIARAALNQQ